MNSSPNIPHLNLANDQSIPILGLGVWKAQDGNEVKNAVTWALEAGYRSIDTAAIYGNEEGVGAAIAASNVERSDIFLTTKIWNEALRNDNVEEAFETSLKRLNQDYVDLLLIHWPVAGKCKAAWKHFERFYDQGRAKAIGVSNFMPEHLEDLMESANIKPMLNQIEFHPYLQQKPTVDLCHEAGILVEAWSPLMQGSMEDPVLSALAQKYGKSNAQIILRWDIQKEVITIPKSTNQGRIQENFNVFDFELSAEDMVAIDALERNHRFGPNPYTFSF
jgi:methylglyoxal/glyoxal reductase